MSLAGAQPWPSLCCLRFYPVCFSSAPRLLKPRLTLFHKPHGREGNQSRTPHTQQTKAVGINFPLKPQLTPRVDQSKPRPLVITCQKLLLLRRTETMRIVVRKPILLSSSNGARLPPDPSTRSKRHL